MTLSPIFSKSSAQQMATVIFAPMAVIFACYAPTLASNNIQDNMIITNPEQTHIVGNIA